MKNKWVKYSAISLGVILILLLIGNFAMNYWLQNNLPNYIKENTDYKIDYADINVELGTGNILLTKIDVQNINPNNHKIIGLQGKIDTLKISRLGIYDAVFNKKINSSQLLMVNPDLKITLAKAKDAKEARKESPVLFKNISIKNGNISIFKPNNTKYFSIQNLNAKIEDIELVDDAENKILPIEFSRQEVNGSHLFFRPDQFKLIKAVKIRTENDLLSIDRFQIIPLLTYAQFAKYNNNNNYFEGEISKLELKEFSIKKGEININSASITNPNLKMYTFQNSIKKEKKPLKHEVNLDDFKIKDAHFQVFKGENDSVFSVSNLQVAISKIEMNEETSKNKIPFNYDDFKISGNNIESNSGTQKINIQALSIDPKTIQLNTILLNSINNKRVETAIDGSIKNIQINTKVWEFKNNKLKLDVENVLIDGLNGKLFLGKNSSNKKRDFGGIEFPLLVRKISLKNSNLELQTGKQPLDFKNLNAEILNLEMNAATIKNKTPFKIGSYNISASNFKYKVGEFYNATAASLKINEKQILLSNIALKPTVSRAQFLRSIPVERDLYDLTIKQLTANGTWNFLSNSNAINATNMKLDGMNANIFRSKVPKDDLTVKPLYSSMLKQIKFPLYIADFNIVNSTLVYEEDTPKSDGPGKLVFGNFNLNAKNINSGKTPGKPTKIPITIKCLLMNSSPLTVNWSFDTATTNDLFAISGYTGNMSASQLNLFVEPYLKVRATGNIARLTFDFKGNKRALSGSFKIAHQNLKVEVLNKQGEKDGIISAVANIFVKTDSGKFPVSVEVENIERDNTKSFFNFLWKGLQEGLSKSLLGIGTVDKVETAAKNNSKVTEAKKVKTPEPKKEEKKEEKKGFFEKIFK